MAAKDYIIFFEQTYRIIFSSQIALLLAVLNNAQSSEYFVANYYQTAAFPKNSFYKNESWDWRQYINFLLERGLIDEFQSNDSLLGNCKFFRVTDVGKAFIQYLRTQNMVFEKDSL